MIRATVPVALCAALGWGCAHAPVPPSGAVPPGPAGQPAPPLPPSPPAPPAPPAQPSPPAGGAVPAPAEIVFAAVGDVMLGSAFPDEEELPPDDGAAELAEVAPILSAADVVFGNLEGPLVDGGTSEKCAHSRPGRCYAFRVPTRYGRTLRGAGFTVMSLANNHAGDFGAAGRESTRRVLDALGIAHSGEPGDVARLLVKGRRLALVAFATSEATYDLDDLETARRVVADLKVTADLVVVSFHGGAEGAAHQHVPAGPEEFYGESRGDLRTFAHAMVDAGAALVIGHGPHVVRGMEVYRGRLVAYSLGNFATWGRFNLSGPNGLSLVLEARLGPDGAFRSGRVVPVRQVKPGGARRDPSGEIIPVLRRLSREDFGETAVEVGPDGELAPPRAEPHTPSASAPAAVPRDGG